MPIEGVQRANQNSLTLQTLHHAQYTHNTTITYSNYGGREGHLNVSLEP